MNEPDSEPAGESEDGLLDGRLRILQPMAGYRVAIDPIFLAAAVPAGPGDLVLDAGTGVGAAALCLAWRVPGARVRGIELQPDLLRLAIRNFELNGLAGRADAMLGDILRPPPRLAPGGFAHVMANPPHQAPGTGPSSPHTGKAAANREGEARLSDWVRFCFGMVRPQGSVTFIHRADRLEDLLAALAGQGGEIVVFPLWPGVGKPASRILVRARKANATPTRLAPGLVLHEADGRYTPAAEAVLRQGAGLVL
jgi:tRNA1(Val) A37 N6-methylase TrmN6